MTLIEQIKGGESKILELKQILPKNDKLVKSVIAFANTAGGRIVIGVSDDREIIGIQEGDIFSIKDSIANAVSDSCFPNILPEIYTVNVEDKLLLVVEVFRGNLLPYYAKKEGKDYGTYIRVGATTRKASADNIKELERQRNNISYDEEICYEAEYSSLDITPVQERFAKVGKVLDEQKLKTFKLIKQENGRYYPTNALMIILGLFEHCTVRCARFKGDDMDSFLDKKDYSGDIFSQVDSVVLFLLSNIRTPAAVVALELVTSSEVPVTALREAVINAFIHRDYSNSGRDIKVAVYDKTIKIISPGCFPNTITIKDIEEGRSETRNKTIARVFRELNLIEQWGSGINRMKSVCVKNGLKEPEVLEKGDFVEAVIYRSNETSDAGQSSEIVGNRRQSSAIVGNRRQSSPHETAILYYLKDHGQINAKEAEVLLGLKESQVRLILRKMVDAELISRNGHSVNTHYKILINDN